MARLTGGDGWSITPANASNSQAEKKKAKSKLRVQVQKRPGGRFVTVIEGLSMNDAAVHALAAELKELLGAGGTCAGGVVEVQGDHREKIVAILAGKGLRLDAR